MAFVVGCLLMVATASVGIEIVIRHRLNEWLGPPLHFLGVFLYHVVTAVSSFTVALMAFVVLFQRLPYRPMRLRHAWPGALLTAVLWEVARLLFTLLLPFFNYRQVYGSIGVMVCLMTWAYISSAVMLFGAQVSRGLYGTFKPPGAPIGTGIPISTLKTLGR
jgi:membrane protein